jgi:hypothetical protein
VDLPALALSSDEVECKNQSEHLDLCGEVDVALREVDGVWALS